MGIGMALMEETLFDDRQGRIMNPSLAEYHVPVNSDVPEIEIHFLNIPNKKHPMAPAELVRSASPAPRRQLRMRCVTLLASESEICRLR